MKAQWAPYTLDFKEEAITSRARMRRKQTYFLRLTDDKDLTRIGEVPLFQGLSAEDSPHFEHQLAQVCTSLTASESTLEKRPDTGLSSVNFGLESARFPTSAAGPITINGLVWMGSKRQMFLRLRRKLESGFRCVKLKIGGIDFAQELELLRYVRRQFSPAELELRLDANGAFTPANAMERLERLSEFQPHSIEQPIRAAQLEAMALLCLKSPVPIALDEELIGTRSDAEKVQLLDAIRPQYIILKPALCGGFAHADRWIALAAERGIGWWATNQ